MRFYSVVKANAQEFANERKQEVYICRAKRKNDMHVIFDKKDKYKNYDIIETVRPETGGVKL